MIGAMAGAVHTAAYGRVRAVLVRAREEAGLTQRGLAERLGVHRSWVAKVELGERRLDVVEFCHLCDAIGVEPGTVLREAGMVRSPRGGRTSTKGAKGARPGAR